jgi:hypothetical protein
MQIPGPKTAAIGAIRFGTRSGIFRLVDTQFRREQVGLSPSAMPGVSDECFPDHCDDQLVAGYVKTTSSAGLRVYMPDYNKISRPLMNQE